MKNKIEYLLKHNRLFLNLYRFFFSNFFKILGLFVKLDEKTILFAGNSKMYNDSPKAIYEYLVKNGYDREYNLVWAVKEIGKYGIKGIHQEVKMDSLSYFIWALKAKYWITSVNIERGLKFKKKATKFLNTWHGVAINKMGCDVQNRTDFNWSDVDYICYSNESEVQIYKSAFNARQESMIPCGLPRNDELYRVTEEEIQKIKNNLGIPLDKKVLLYAPTWRDSADFGKNYEIKPPIDWELWEKELSQDYVLLLRTHPYTTKLLDVNFNDFIRDFSNYAVINDLLKVADVLISDYSSIFFDYCVLERPVFCFGYDYDAYIKVRGFYYDLNKELPNGVIKDQRALLSSIKHMNYEDQCAKVRNMKNKHVAYGGSATETCVRCLLKGSVK